MMYLTGGAHSLPSQHASSCSNGCISMQKAATIDQGRCSDWNYCSKLHRVHCKPTASIRWGPYNKADAKRHSTARVHLQYAIHYESWYNLPKPANFTTYGLLAEAIANAGPITISIQDSIQEYHGRRGAWTVMAIWYQSINFFTFCAFVGAEPHEDGHQEAAIVAQLRLCIPTKLKLETVIRRCFEFKTLTTISHGPPVEDRHTLTRSTRAGFTPRIQSNSSSENSKISLAGRTTRSR